MTNVEMLDMMYEELLYTARSSIANNIDHEGWPKFSRGEQCGIMAGLKAAMDMVKCHRAWIEREDVADDHRWEERGLYPSYGYELLTEMEEWMRGDSHYYSDQQSGITREGYGDLCLKAAKYDDDLK